MKPEEQRIAIAEACGWKRHPWKGKLKFGPDWESPDGRYGYQEAIPDGLDAHYISPPNYLTDLNAMHGVEKVLTKEQAHKYIVALQMIKYGEHKDGPTGKPPINGFCTHATAAQRAEAFLKTLNLWTP